LVGGMWWWLVVCVVVGGIDVIDSIFRNQH